MLRRRRDRSRDQPADPGAPAGLPPAAGPDPGVLAEVPARVRPQVDDALAAQQRWRALVAGQGEGPLRDRLAGWTDRIDAAVAEVLDTAARVGRIESTARALEPERTTAAFKAARRAQAAGDAPPELELLEARFASVQRLLNAVGEAEERLRLLDARLGAIVARGAELSLLGWRDGADRLDQDLDRLADELGHLRAALGDLGARPA